MIKTYYINSTQALYDDAEFAWLQSLLLEEGVLADKNGTMGLSVTEKSGGADMSVDVGAGKALVEITKNGDTFKVVVENDASVNVPIAANSSGSNRIDAIVVRVDVDTEPNTLKSNVGTIERVAGTGVSALSDGAITSALGSDGWVRIADITVANAASSIVTADISDQRVKVSTNSAINLAGATPVGGTMDYAGSSAPTGFLLCRGQAVSRTTYASLFAIIGTDWGAGDGSTTFNVPDLRRRVTVGMDNNASVTTVEDCEDTWDGTVVAGVSVSLDTSDKKVGSGSVRLIVDASVSAGAVLATENIGNVDFYANGVVSLWLKPSVAVAAGDLQLILGENADGSSPVEAVNIPALAANVWQRVHLQLDAPALGLRLSYIGIKMVNDIGAFSLWIDDVITSLFSEVGKIGGQERHKMSVPEIATHRHGGVPPPGSSSEGSSVSTWEMDGVGETSDAGESRPFLIVQPYAVMNKIIRY